MGKNVLLIRVLIAILNVYTTGVAVYYERIEDQSATVAFLFEHI